MKRILLNSTLLIIASAFMFSCSDDDETNVKEDDSFSYKNKSYDITHTMILDWGAVSFYGEQEESHYRYYFILGNGEYGYVDDPNNPGKKLVTRDGVSYELYFKLSSPSTDKFVGGTFPVYTPSSSPTVSEVKDKYLLQYGEVWFDTNGNGNYEQALDEVALATNGEVTVSGSGTDLTISYDLTLDNGETVQGQYSGTFPIYAK